MDARQKVEHSLSWIIPTTRRWIEALPLPALLPRSLVHSTLSQAEDGLRERLASIEAAELDHQLARIIWWLGRHRSADAPALLVHPEHGTITLDDLDSYGPLDVDGAAYEWRCELEDDGNDWELPGAGDGGDGAVGDQVGAPGAAGGPDRLGEVGAGEAAG